MPWSVIAMKECCSLIPIVIKKCCPHFLWHGLSLPWRSVADGFSIFIKKCCLHFLSHGLSLPWRSVADGFQLSSKQFCRNHWRPAGLVEFQNSLYSDRYNCTNMPLFFYIILHCVAGFVSVVVMKGLCVLVAFSGLSMHKFISRKFPLHCKTCAIYRMEVLWFCKHGSWCEQLANWWPAPFKVHNQTLQIIVSRRVQLQRYFPRDWMLARLRHGQRRLAQVSIQTHCRVHLCPPSCLTCQACGSTCWSGLSMCKSTSWSLQKRSPATSHYVILNHCPSSSLREWANSKTSTWFWAMECRATSTPWSVPMQLTAHGSSRGRHPERMWWWWSWWRSAMWSSGSPLSWSPQRGSPWCGWMPSTWLRENTSNRTDGNSRPLTESTCATWRRWSSWKCSHKTLGGHIATWCSWAARICSRCHSTRRCGIRGPGWSNPRCACGAKKHRLSAPFLARSASTRPEMAFEDVNLADFETTSPAM